MRTLPKALGVLAVAALLSACSGEVSIGEQTIDSGELEETISTQLEEQVGEVPKSVDCPDDISGEADSTFTCTVTDSNDVTADVEGVFTDDEGNFSIEVVG